MWWECSECGGTVHRELRPSVCPECGTAGAIFMPAESNDAMAAEPDGDSLRSLWFRAGLERPDLVASS